MFNQIQTLSSRAILMAAILLSALGTKAATFELVDSSHKGSIEMDLSLDYIEFQGKKFYFNQEKIVDAYGVGSNDMFTGASSECRATTLQAKRVSERVIVLLEATRSKQSKSHGILCALSNDANEYRNPHHYEHTVLRFDTEGSTVEIEHLEVRDSIGRPDLSVQELLQDDLLNNQRFSDFVKRELNDGDRSRVSAFKGSFKRIGN